MKLGALLFGAALACAAGGVADAGTISYELTGIGDGTLNGAAYSGPFQIVAIGQTSGVQEITSPANIFFNGADPFGVSIGPLDITITLLGIGSVNVTDPAYVFYVPSPNVAGFGASTDGDFLDVVSPLLSGYDLASSIGPLAVDVAYTGSVNTQYGVLTFNDVSGAQFSSVAIPEPATWIMMLAGLGVIGAAARMARRKAAAAVASA